VAVEITFIVRDRADPGRVTRLGGNGGWLRAESSLIADIENGLRSYFIQVGPARIGVVVFEEDGRKYLRSDPEETRQNELLGLPEASAGSWATHSSGTNRASY
jgi:hypothetical protein